MRMKYTILKLLELSRLGLKLSSCIKKLRQKVKNLQTWRIFGLDNCQLSGKFQTYQFGRKFLFFNSVFFFSGSSARQCFNCFVIIDIICNTITLLNLWIMSFINLHLSIFSRVTFYKSLIV